MLRLSLTLVALVIVTACHGTKGPELRVLGVRAARDTHVFVQVTNPASRPLRLTKLEYTFASAKSKAVLSHGEVDLAREIPSGAAVVLEVPIDPDTTEVREALTLRGKLTAELDQIVRTFRVDADINPP